MRVTGAFPLMNGQPITTVDDLPRLLLGWPVAQPITLSVLHIDERRGLTVYAREGE